MQASDDFTLHGDQAGRMAMCRQLVTRFQSEIVRSCYLLTADNQRARQLAVASLLNFFDEADLSEDPAKLRVDLLKAVGRRYLHGDRPVDAEPLPSMGVPLDAAPQRYHVEGERERLLRALERLELVARLAVVLREYNRLDEESVARVVGATPYTLHELLEPARRRLREAVSAPEDESIRGLLDIAAGGAPRPNLWPLIEEPLREQEQERQALGQRLTLAMTGGVVLLLILGALWLVVGFDWLTGGDDGDAAGAMASPSPATTAIAPPTPVPEPSPTPLPNIASLGIPQGDVPSTPLLTTFARPQTVEEEQQVLFSYDIGANQLTPVFEGRIVPITISPDGRWLLSYLPDQAGTGYNAIQLIDTRANQVQWTKGFLDTGSLDAFAFVSDRLYAINEGPPSHLVVFNIETGEEIARREDVIDELWTFDRHPLISEVQLFVTPGGGELWVSVIGSWPSRSPTMLTSWGRVLASYSLPDLTLQSKQEMLAETEDEDRPSHFLFEDAIFTLDGSYLVTADQAADQLIFSSPREDEAVVLDLAFSQLNRRSPEDLTLIPSNTGRHLYVLATVRGEVAIVDLLSRSVVRLVTLDAAGFGLQPVLDSQGRAFPAEVILSPDDTRLYIANAWNLTGQLGGEEHGAPITVIDATTWRVVGQWDVPSDVGALFLLDGGRLVAVAHTVTATDPPSLYPIKSLTIFDAATGEVLLQRSQRDIPLPEWAGDFSVLSLYNLYRRSHGRSPTVDGQPVADVGTLSSLPRVRLSAGEAPIPVRQIEVRIEDPVTGGPLAGARDDVRFDPESVITVTLRHRKGEAGDVLVVLRRDADGVYRGTATLGEIGVWDAVVTVNPPEGEPWSVGAVRAISVSASMEGTDGRFYVASLAWEPAEPASEAPVEFTVRFVDAESGQPIPEDVDLVAGFPETIDILLTALAADGGFITVTLRPDEHGVYQGSSEIWDTGRWLVWVRFQLPETGEIISLDAGEVTVGS